LTKRAGIVVALPQELKTLTGRPLERGDCLEIFDNVFVCLSGIGKTSALKAAAKLIEEGADILISWGTAASLDVKIAPGTIIIPESVILEDNTEIDTDPSAHKIISELLLHENAEIHCKLCETSELLRDYKQKVNLGLQNRAIAADMESGAVAELSKKYDIPFVVIRTVSDSPEMILPPVLTKNMTVSGDIDIFQFIRSALLNPRQWKTIYKLSRGFGKAKKSLKLASDKLFPGLIKELDTKEGALDNN